jgi:hypothetical protein
MNTPMAAALAATLALIPAAHAAVDPDSAAYQGGRFLGYFAIALIAWLVIKKFLKK